MASSEPLKSAPSQFCRLFEPCVSETANVPTSKGSTAMKGYQGRNTRTVREVQRYLFCLYAASRFYSRDFKSAARGRTELGLFDTVTTLITLAGTGCRDIRTAAIAK